MVHKNHERMNLGIGDTETLGMVVQEYNVGLVHT
jgi:hypothetical protein